MEGSIIMYVSMPNKLLRKLLKLSLGVCIKLELVALSSISEDLLDYAEILDQYYIPPRYPNAFSEGTPSEYYTRRQAEEALRYAEELVGFARRIVREGIGRSY